jgi:Protein of unknown function (DUF2568)
VRPANDVLRFSLEMAMLAALAVSGFELGDGAWGWVLGIGLPLLAAGVWGVALAPKSERRVSDPARLAFELLLFGAAAAALVAAGHPALGVVFAVLVLAHLALTFPLGQRVA